MSSQEHVEKNSSWLRDSCAQRGLQSFLVVVLSIGLLLPCRVAQAQFASSPHVAFTTPMSKTANRPSPAPPPSNQESNPKSSSPPTQDSNAYLPETQGKAENGFRVDPVNWNIVLAGNILTGVGIAGFLVMAGGLAARHDAQERMSTGGSTSNLACLQRKRDKLRRQREVGEVLALSGGISAAVLVSTGLGLMFWGRAREKKRRESFRLQRRSGMRTRMFSWIPELKVSIPRRRVHAMWSLRF